MLVEFGTKDCERLMCTEEDRPLSVNDAFDSVREHGDYYFEVGDPKNPIFLGLVNKEDAMNQRDCTCHFLPYKIIDGTFVTVDGPEVTFSSGDEQFKAVVVVARCPDDEIIGTSRYKAKRRTIIGQGVEENIKLAYLV